MTAGTTAKSFSPAWRKGEERKRKERKKKREKGRKAKHDVLLESHHRQSALSPPFATISSSSNIFVSLYISLLSLYHNNNMRSLPSPPSHLIILSSSCHIMPVIIVCCSFCSFSPVYRHHLLSSSLSCLSLLFSYLHRLFILLYISLKNALKTKQNKRRKAFS